MKNKKRHLLFLSISSCLFTSVFCAFKPDFERLNAESYARFENTYQDFFDRFPSQEMGKYCNKRSTGACTELAAIIIAKNYDNDTLKAKLSAVAQEMNVSVGGDDIQKVYDEFKQKMKK